MCTYPLFRRLVTFTLAFLLGFQSFGGYAIAIESSPSFDSCQTIQPVELRSQLTHEVQRAFAEKTDFNLDTKVSEQWELLKVDTMFDRAVADAVAAVRSDTTLIDKFASSWSGEKAKELASSILVKAMADQELQRLLTQLSEDVTGQIASQISTATLESSEHSVACLRSFIGKQYGAVFVDRFNTDNSRQLSRVSEEISDDSPFELDKSDKKIILVGSGVIGVGGFAIRQIARKVMGEVEKCIMANMAKRILGRLGSTAIPFIGEVIGGGLLIYDLSMSFDGSFDAIQAQFQSPETKSLLKSEVSKAVSEGSGKDLSEIPVGIANDLYTKWLNFQKDYTETLAIANEIPELKQLVEQPGSDLERTAQLVRLSLDSMGKFELIAAIQGGSFGKALTLPLVIDQIIEQTGSIETAVLWSDLADDRLADVARLKLPKVLSLDGLSSLLLGDLLALNDDITIQKLAASKPDVIQQLLEISPSNLVKLAQSVSKEQLAGFAVYLANLERQEANELVGFLNGTPGSIRNAEVITHIVKSRNIHRAILLFQADTAGEVGPLQFLRHPLTGIFGEIKKLVGVTAASQFLGDLSVVLTGQVSWGLLNDKYGQVATITYFAVILAILLMTLTLGFWLYGKFLDMRRKQLSVDILKQQKKEVEARNIEPT
jgi:hypothetical protein